MVEARFRRFGLDGEWFQLSGNDMEKMKSLIEVTIRGSSYLKLGKQFVEAEGFHTMGYCIREIDPEQPEGILRHI
jgi:hypothetical protein